MTITGKVKFIHPTGGYGFIYRDDGEESLFVHQSAVVGQISLEKGTPVEFEVIDDARSGKKRAVNVRVLA